MDISHLYASKNVLKYGPGARLDGDASNFVDARRHGEILQPQLKDGRYFHIVADSVNFNKTHARCISCQRPQRLSNFWLSEDGKKFAKRRNFVLDARCNACRKLERDTELATHSDYTPELDAYWTSNFRSLCGGARARNIEISITKDILVARYLRNRGKCEVTGIQLRPQAGRKNRLAPSVDRIDSAGEYSQCNIQIVARCVNIMKGDMDTEEFLTWCKLIASKN